MRAFVASVFVVGLLAGVPAFGADETYSLKLYKSKKGDKITHEKSDSGKLSFSFTANGKTMKEDETNGMKEAYTEEILEKKDGAKLATKLTRTYTVAEQNKKGETTKAVYAGQTVLIEKKGEKYEFSIKGKALKEDEAPELFKNFNEKKENEPQNDDFLPKDPIKVGESWKIPAAKSEEIFKSFGDDKLKIDQKKSTVAGKLLKAYKKDGAQFGAIELTVTIFVTEMDLGGQFVKTKPDSKVIMKFTADTCIDGTVPFEDGKMEMTMEISAEVANVGSLTIVGTTTGTDKSRALKK